MRINKELPRSAKRFLAVFALTAVMALSAMPVRAQTPAPDEADLMADISAMPTEQAAPTIPTRPDPCPMPSLAMAETPDDLAKIQSDIDRYTLCVERAQLLQRLNSLALENQEKLLESGGLDPANPGMMLDGGAAAASFEAQQNEIMGMAQSAAASPDMPDYPEGWVILGVFGSSEGLQARLTNADGELAQVKQGDTLSDGSVVSAISPTSVSISREGEQETLKWNDMAQAEEEE